MDISRGSGTCPQHSVLHPQVHEHLWRTGFCICKHKWCTVVRPHPALLSKAQLRFTSEVDASEIKEGTERY